MRQQRPPRPRLPTQTPPRQPLRRVPITREELAALQAEGSKDSETVGDAMRKEVYPALFSCGGGRVVRLGPDTVAKPEDVAAGWATGTEGPLLLAGNGLRKYAAVFSEVLGERASFAPESSWTPTGESLLLAEWRVREAGCAGDGDPALILPVYTRLSDAEENENARTVAHRRLAENGVAGPSSTGERP